MSDSMQQNATYGDALSPAQLIALAALLGGQTITAAALAADVDRATLYRWMRNPEKPGFRKALQRGRRELRQAMRARLVAMLPKMGDCLESSLTQGESRTAIALLRGLGFLPGPPKLE